LLWALLWLGSWRGELIRGDAAGMAAGATVEPATRVVPLAALDGEGTLRDGRAELGTSAAEE